MFEDLEKFLHDHKKPIPEDDLEIEDSDSVGKQIEKALKKEFGGKANIQFLGSKDKIPKFEVKDCRTEIKKLINSFENLARSLETIAKAVKIEPSCNLNGKQLKVGDVLQCGNSKQIKTVISLGYGFCTLSHTDNQTKSDGIWFEDEMIKKNFKL